MQKKHGFMLIGMIALIIASLSSLLLLPTLEQKRGTSSHVLRAIPERARTRGAAGSRDSNTGATGSQDEAGTSIKVAEPVDSNVDKLSQSSGTRGTGDSEMEPSGLEDSSGTQGAPERAPSITFSQCEKDYIGWNKFRRWFSNQREICSGFTTATCATRDGKAWFCFFRNLVETCHKGQRQWTAFCKLRVPLSDSYMQEFHKRSAIRSGRLKFVDGDPPEQRHTSDFNFTYLAAGDCAEGSPGHCIADHQQFFLVRELLGFRKQDCTVIMESGFGKSVDEFAETGLLDPGKVSASDPRQRVRNASDLVYIHDWPALADRLQVGDAAGVCVDGAVYGVAAVSPHSMNAPHWRGFKDNPKDEAGSHTCQGRSQALLALRALVAPHMAAAAAAAGLPAGSVVGCAARDWQGVTTLNQEACGGGRFVLWLVRGRAYRSLVNEEEVVAALAQADGRLMVKANMGRLSFLQQFLLVTGAGLVAGMHGGAMWNAARCAPPRTALGCETTRDRAQALTPRDASVHHFRQGWG